MSGDCLSALLNRVHRAIKADLDRRLAPRGVSSAEWPILMHCAGGSLTPASLAESLDVDRAAITRLVCGLEQKGLLDRRMNPTDGRSALIGLTESGRRLLPTLKADSLAANRAILRHLPPEEGEALARSLLILAEALPCRSSCVEGGSDG